MAVAPSCSVTGVGDLAAALATAAATLDVTVDVVVRKAAVDLCALVQVNASGRPGPNAPTGDYRGSWRVDHVFTGSDFVTYAVGTDRPQANRLEFGFVGTDSLGRVYDQPPFPHMGPAVDVIDPVFAAAMQAVADRAVVL